mgnify:CR=1 FL=1
MAKLDLTTPVHTLAGVETDLTAHEGKVLLIVNTASKCGLTPHFEGLQALHSSYAEQGLAVLGFPCNQFGKQDPGTNEEIGAFCEKNYGVSFPMHAKIEVNGDNTHPLFVQLKAGAKGTLGNRIKWNFTKFLVAKDGTILKRYAPTTEPGAIEADIQAALKA